MSETAAPAVIDDRVVGALKKCYDPEIPVNIYDLGLIYSIEVSPSNEVDIKMTLTAPACPVAGTLPGDVERRVRDVEGVKEVKVELVWDPPWRPDMMSKMARVMLGM
jgi:FeS assembly SUF system protein